MGYYSDPTATQAVGNVNREFSKMEKEARRIRRQWEAGRLTEDDLDEAERRFGARYCHVLRRVFMELSREEKRRP